MSNATIVDYGASIWMRRYFWCSLVLLDLRNRYKRSVLGLGWTLANPIAMTTVLCVVFRAIFGVDLREYAPFVLSGMAFWNYVSGAVIEGCHCFYTSESYIRSTPAPMAIYSLRTTLGLTVHFCVVFMLTLVMAIALRGPVVLMGLPYLLAFLPLLFVFCWSLATIFGFMNVFFPDVQHLATIGMQLLFYLSPVFCPPSLLESRGLGFLTRYNPLARMLELIREPILHGRAPSWQSAVVACAATAVTSLIAWRMLKKHQQSVIFHL